MRFSRVLIVLLLVPVPAFSQTERPEVKARALAGAASAHERAQRLAEAEPLLAEATALQPQNTSILSQYASLLWRLGKSGDAERIYNRLIEIENTPENHHKMALFLKAQKRLEEAETHFASAGETSVYMLIDRAETNMELRRFVEMERFVAKAISINPGRGHRWAADLYARMDRFEEALAAARAALPHIESDRPDILGRIWAIIAEALYHLERFGEAVAAMGEALRLAPNDRAIVKMSTAITGRTLPRRAPVTAAQFQAMMRPVVNTPPTSTAVVTPSPSSAPAQSTPTAPPPRAVDGCVGAKSPLMEGYLHATTKIHGNDILGTYTYPSHSSGRPHAILNSDQDGNGTNDGVYELWGAAAGPGTEVRIEWWVLADCGGTPIEPRTGDFILMVRWGAGSPANPPGSFSNLIWRNYQGVMSINGERAKR